MKKTRIVGGVGGVYGAAGGRGGVQALGMALPYLHGVPPARSHIISPCSVYVPQATLPSAPFIALARSPPCVGEMRVRPYPRQ